MRRLLTTTVSLFFFPFLLLRNLFLTINKMQHIVRWSMRQRSNLTMMCAWTNVEVLEICIFIDLYWEVREVDTRANASQHWRAYKSSCGREKKKMKMWNIKWNFLFLKCKEISLTREWASSSSACYANLLIFFIYFLSLTLVQRSLCIQMEVYFEFRSSAEPAQR